MRQRLRTWLAELTVYLFAGAVSFVIPYAIISGEGPDPSQLPVALPYTPASLASRRLVPIPALVRPPAPVSALLAPTVPLTAPAGSRSDSEPPASKPVPPPVLEPAPRGGSGPVLEPASP
jgi:hypothetical protein